MARIDVERKVAEIEAMGLEQPSDDDIISFCEGISAIAGREISPAGLRRIHDALHNHLLYPVLLSEDFDVMTALSDAMGHLKFLLGQKST